MKWPFGKRENTQEIIEVRSSEQEMIPHKEEPTDACTEASKGLGLLNKILNISGYNALTQSPFFCAINLISNSVASMSWDVKAKNNNEVPEDIYINHLFDNALLTQFITVKNMIKDMLIHGAALSYIHRDASGIPVRIEYVPWNKWGLIYNELTNELYYYVNHITPKAIEPVNVLHLIMHSEDGIYGKSILELAKNTIKLNGNAEKSAIDYFNSGMQVQGILRTDTPRLTKDQRSNIHAAWNESQLGSGSGVAVLEGGMTYQPVSSNSKDAQLLETRVFNVQEVARWFNMHPALLGDLSKTSYNTVEAAQLQFVVNTLAPYVELLQQELNRKLLLNRDKLKYYIDIAEEDIIKSDKSSQASYLNTLVQSGIMTRNEARKQIGLNPVEGGDDLVVAYTDINQNKINQDNNQNKDEDKNTDKQEDEEES